MASKSLNNGDPFESFQTWTSMCLTPGVFRMSWKAIELLKAFWFGFSTEDRQSFVCDAVEIRVPWRQFLLFRLRGSKQLPRWNDKTATFLHRIGSQKSAKMLAWTMQSTKALCGSGAMTTWPPRKRRRKKTVHLLETEIAEEIKWLTGIGGQAWRLGLARKMCILLSFYNLHIAYDSYLRLGKHQSVGNRPCHSLGETDLDLLQLAGLGMKIWF